MFDTVQNMSWRNSGRLVGLVSVLAAVACEKPPAPAPPLPRLVVVIVVDQLRGGELDEHRVLWRHGERHRHHRPSRGRCRDPLVFAMRKAAVEVTLKRPRPTAHIPRPILELRPQQVVEAVLINRIRRLGFPANVQGQERAPRCPRIARQIRQLRPTTIVALCSDGAQASSISKVTPALAGRRSSSASPIADAGVKKPPPTPREFFARQTALSPSIFEVDP